VKIGREQRARGQRRPRGLLRDVEANRVTTRRSCAMREAKINARDAEVRRSTKRARGLERAVGYCASSVMDHRKSSLV
jgi:hypothetical protein